MISTTMKMEHRYPLADINLLEFSLALPFDYKIHKGTSRYLLREVMKNKLPKSIYDNQKLSTPTFASLHLPFINSFEETLVLIEQLKNSSLFEKIDFHRITNHIESAYEGFENKGITHPYSSLFSILQLLVYLEMEQKKLVLN